MVRFARAAALALSIVLLPSLALANPEPSANDARVVGIGGASAAYLDNPSVIYINPAGLARMEGRFQLTLSSTALIVDAFAPIESPDEVNHTGWRAAPLPFFGVAARLHERVVLGLGMYIATGYGSSYNDISQVSYLNTWLGNTDPNLHRTQVLAVPMDQSVTFFEGEVALTGAFKLHELLDLGIALRLPFAKQTASLYEELLPANSPIGNLNAIWGSVKQDVGGIGPPGVLVGLTLHPVDELDLALSYRSKVRIDMDGTIEINAEPPNDALLRTLGFNELGTSTAWYLPHKIRGGFALHLFERRFMIAGDFYIQFHEEANRAQIFHNRSQRPGITLPADFATLPAPFLWKNVYGGALGFEVMATEHFPIRFGGSMSNSATSAAGAQYFTPPDSLLGSASVGVGAHYDRFDADFGTQLSWGRGSIPVNGAYCQGGDQVKIGCPGRYGVTSIFFTLSLTVRIGDFGGSAPSEGEGEAWDEPLLVPSESEEPGAGEEATAPAETSEETAPPPEPPPPVDGTEPPPEAPPAAAP